MERNRVCLRCHPLCQLRLELKERRRILFAALVLQQKYVFRAPPLSAYFKHTTCTGCVPDCTSLPKLFRCLFQANGLAATCFPPDAPTGSTSAVNDISTTGLTLYGKIIDIKGNQPKAQNSYLIAHYTSNPPPGISTPVLVTV